MQRIWWIMRQDIFERTKVVCVDNQQGLAGGGGRGGGDRMAGQQDKNTHTHTQKGKSSYRVLQDLKKKSIQCKMLYVLLVSVILFSPQTSTNVLIQSTDYMNEVLLEQVCYLGQK